jgi:RNA polymerase subunit RPABC4/transcription elongation factor Spt4
LSLQDELSDIVSKAEGSDDPEQLAGFQKRCEAILANASKTLASEQDSELREHLQGIEEQAKETLRAAKQRLAEVKIARMDPEYEQNKAQKLREEELKKQREMQQAQQFLSQGGLGGLLGGIFGGAAGVPGASQGGGGAGTAVPSAAAAVTPTAAKCGQCGSELKPGAKFCPECGTPVPRERHCTNCGAKLAPAAKFCPECGTKQG